MKQREPVPRIVLGDDGTLAELTCVLSVHDFVGENPFNTYRKKGLSKTTYCFVN